MKLFQLLNTVEFEAVWPYISEADPESRTSAFAYKQAFDLLRTMKPEESDGTISLYRAQSLWVDNGLESDWHKVLSWEIDLAEDIEGLDTTFDGRAEIAAAILWELTFYGFSPSERSEVMSRRFGCKKDDRPNPYKDKGNVQMARRYDLWQKIVTEHGLDKNDVLLWEKMERADSFDHYDFRTFCQREGYLEYVADMFKNWLPKFDVYGEMLIVISCPDLTNEIIGSISEAMPEELPPVVFLPVDTSTNDYMKLDILAFPKTKTD